MLSFEIPGDPVAKARPRASMVAGRARLYTPAKTNKYEARVAIFAQQAMAGRPVIAGPVALSVTALFPIPASWPKKRQAAARAGTEQHTKKPDLDNVLKAIKGCPVRAGIGPPPSASLAHSCGLPRASGDRPDPKLISLAFEEVAPCERG